MQSWKTCNCPSRSSSLITSRCVAPRSRRPKAASQQSEGGQLLVTDASSYSQLRDWHDIDKPLIWNGDEDAALSAGAPPNLLPAPWKMMLLSDGSVTRHLQLLTGQPIQVECLSMDLLSEQQLHCPPQTALQIPGPLVQRQVLLWSQASPRVPLVYAASWWASSSVDQYLADKNLPIWVSLARGHLELYREIQGVALGHSPELEQHFGCSGPFWGRQYYFWHDGAPLTLIHEVFSNSLEMYLGPNSCREHSRHQVSPEGSIQQHARPPGGPQANGSNGGSSGNGSSSDDGS